VTSRSWAATIGILTGIIRQSPIAGSSPIPVSAAPTSVGGRVEHPLLETEEVMTRVLSSDSNCVDVGAHTGSILRVILRYAGRGHHVAFGAGHDTSA